MEELEVRKVLGNCVLKDNSLHDLYAYLDWIVGETDITLDGVFSLKELEAIVWWVKNN